MIYTRLATAGDRRATTRVVLMLLTTLLASLFVPTTHAQSIRYVAATASGANDGTSWADAYTALQDALAAATTGDEIWVTAGTYYPDEGDGLSENDRSLSFQLKTGVALYGGFTGDETTRDERDWEANITTLSGDLQQDDGADFANTGDNSYRVVFGAGIENTAVLDGFTVTGGNANGDTSDATDRGGGVHNTESNPTLTNLTISGNQAGDDGGGLFNRSDSNPVLTNITISNNQAGSNGGGLANTSSNPVLTNVTISGNRADRFGGGVANETSSPTLTNVTISDNQADRDGGGLFNTLESNPVLTNVTISGNQAGREGGGGVYNSSSSPVLTNVTISGNQAFHGGGLFNTLESNPMLTNVTISGNEAEVLGGGMYSESSSNPTLTNVTISGNQAGLRGGGLFNNVGSNSTIQNSIIWGNDSSNDPQVYPVDNNRGPTYRYSLVRDLDPGGTNLDGTDTTNFLRFVDSESASSAPTTAGDYRLQPGAAAIDAGDSSLLPPDTNDLDGDSDTTEVLPVDRNGNLRVVGDQVDLGAYEYDPALAIVTWPVPATITYGTALDDAQLNATANVTGSFAYTPPAETVLAAGDGQMLSAVFTPDDLEQYETITTTVQLDVQPAPLTITVDDTSGLVGQPLPPFTYTVTGLVNDDTATDVFTTTPTLTTTATADSPPGIYPITGSGAVAPNYTITYITGTLTLTGQAAPTETRLYLPLIRGPR